MIAILALAIQQPAAPDTAAILAAMKPLSFLVGEWEGEGWKMIGGKREPSRANEKVAWEAGGTVLRINGLGLDMAGKTVHEAFGVLFYDPAKKEHRVRTFLSTGASGDFKAEVTANALVWHIPAARPIRYTIKLDGQGRWFEIGEVNVDADRWVQFFEMTLAEKK